MSLPLRSTQPERPHAASAPFSHDGPGTPADAWRAHPSWGTGLRLHPQTFTRVVVVAAHPDDESLGAGGLIASSRSDGTPVDIVCATSGERSHPRSPSTPPQVLAESRARELRQAVAQLGVTPDRVHLLGAPDGSLSEHVGELTRHLVALVGDGRDTVIAAPWRHDGHPDHEAAGTAAAAAARRTGATLWEYPIWFWHWGDPATAPWELLRSLPLGAETLAAKARAGAAHASQVRPLSSSPGDETLLSPQFLAHFADSPEHFLTTPADHCPDDALDVLHQEQAEPWGVDTRWYERRKRSLVLAALPRTRFRRTLEVGCSTGALAQALAERSDSVLAVDRSAHAIAGAHHRLRDESRIALGRLDVPTQWPDSPSTFDLIVVSEVGYFLSPSALEALVGRVASSLDEDGIVVLAHWRHPVEGWVLDADGVHQAFATEALPPLQATYRDRDVEIRVLARDDDWPDPSR